MQQIRFHHIDAGPPLNRLQDMMRRLGAETFGENRYCVRGILHADWATLTGWARYEGLTWDWLNEKHTLVEFRSGEHG